MLVNSYLLFHVGRGGACSDYWVAVKCSIFDEILLPITISPKVLKGFGWNFSCSIHLGRLIPLSNEKLLPSVIGLLQLATNMFFLQQAIFSALERMDLKKIVIQSILHVSNSFTLNFQCLQQIWFLPQPAAILVLASIGLATHCIYDMKSQYMVIWWLADNGPNATSHW